MSKAAVKKPSVNFESKQTSSKVAGEKINKSESSNISLVFDLDSVDFESAITEEEDNVTALDFNKPEEQKAPEMPQEFKFSKEVVSEKKDMSSAGFEIDDSFYDLQSDNDQDKTMKTIIFKPEDLKKLKEELNPTAPAAKPELLKEIEEDSDHQEMSFSEDTDPFSLDENDEELFIGEEIPNHSLDTVEELDHEEFSDEASPLELGTFEEEIQEEIQEEAAPPAQEISAEAFLNEATTEFKLDMEALSETGLEEVEEFSLGDAFNEDSSGSFDISKLTDEAALDANVEHVDFNVSDSIANQEASVIENTQAPQASPDFLADTFDQEDRDDLTGEFNFREIVIAPPPKNEMSQEVSFEARPEARPEVSHEKNTETTSHAHQDQTLQEQFDIHATIRALRLERETFIEEVKTLKVSLKEYEQDILSMRANLEESRIEVAILRKRNITEIEDYKYKLVIAEDKMLRAQEIAKNAQDKSLRLEQKMRIDYGQVKHREKELESKLELLTMDVDAQINSRDQKILELRRKIDSLEFNMENASIREQKSNEDKKRLEDRLGKMMKTLKHSIKHLEDEIEEVDQDHQSQKDKN